MLRQHAKLIDLMMQYESGNTARIQHFIKVHDLAAAIGRLEGLDEAERLMREAGDYNEEQIARVKYLIAHHHTYNDIKGLDYQILVEADFLVNLFESKNKKKYKAILKNNLFKTKTGIKFLNNMFIV